jgi:hypothetical protein
MNYALRLVQADGKHSDLADVELERFPPRGTIIELPAGDKTRRMTVLFVAVAPQALKAWAADQIWAREI